MLGLDDESHCRHLVIGGVELAQVTRDALLKRGPAPLDFPRREVAVAIVDRLELAADWANPWAIDNCGDRLWQLMFGPRSVEIAPEEVKINVSDFDGMTPREVFGLGLQFTRRELDSARRRLVQELHTDHWHNARPEDASRGKRRSNTYAYREAARRSASPRRTFGVTRRSNEEI